MEEISVASLDTNKLEAMAQEIYVDLTEDSLRFCFEVHRAVKCGCFHLEFAEMGGVKEFGRACRPLRCALPGEPGSDRTSNRSARPQNSSRRDLREAGSDQDDNSICNDFNRFEGKA